jgi:hypothetical protein
MTERRWNYLQVESEGRMLHPTAGPGGLTRSEAHARVRALLVLHAETAAHAAPLVDAWDAGAADDTVYAGSLVWCIYEADDAVTGARAWVDDLAARLRGSGGAVRIAW